MAPAAGVAVMGGGVSVGATYGVAVAGDGRSVGVTCGDAGVGVGKIVTELSDFLALLKKPFAKTQANTIAKALTSAGIQNGVFCVGGRLGSRGNREKGRRSSSH